MVPKIHAKGSSFVGLGRYVLFDKNRATTSDRVAWTMTRNLATDRPELAARLMAATAMDAARLKASAGVKNTGRKSDKSVLHVTLSWHPDEAEELTPEEMQRAAKLAIRALGAEDRQALIVAHSDEDQPHVHLVINRTSPIDGRMLSSSKEKLNLSRWALKYEEERGQILCEQRRINNDARDRGEYVRGEKDTPRHIYEQHLANDNRPRKGEQHRNQQAKDRQVGKQQRAVRDKQAAAWVKLQRDHKTRRLAVLERRRRDTHRAKNKIQDTYRTEKFTQLYHEQQAELRAFERDERRVLGRFKNRFNGLDLKGLIGRVKRERSVGPVFDAVASSGAGLERLKRTHEKQKASLRGQQRRDIAAAAREIRASARDELKAAGNTFQTERASLILRCALENAKMRTEWVQRAKNRGEDTPAEKNKSHKPDDSIESVKERLRKAREDRENGPDRPRRKR